MEIGFIGCGNMASAMINGIINSDLIKGEDIIACDRNDYILENAQMDFEINTTKDMNEVVEKSDIIVIAVKPNGYREVLETIKEKITLDKIIITIAAGISINFVEEIIGNDKKIIRTMPNTPAFVGEGMTAICKNKNISEKELKTIELIFNSFGESEVLDESLIDVVVGTSGSSPAFCFMFIEAMADCAVKYGMSRDTAYKFVSQSLLGSAKMVLESGTHPAKLKDNVCSPGGTTIEGVLKLEEEGFRKSVISGMSAVIEKSIKMSK
ncbi:MAG: pyrroline-5-carboxylate reductase [Peptostreptococcaceae bacterium]